MQTSRKASQSPSENDELHKMLSLTMLLLSAFFAFLSLLLFFDTGLLSLANIFFIFGMSAYLGLKKMGQMMIQLNRLPGTILMVVGLVLVLMGTTVFGFLFEIVGSYLLFKAIIPEIFANVISSAKSYAYYLMFNWNQE